MHGFWLGSVFHHEVATDSSVHHYYSFESNTNARSGEEVAGP